MDETSAEYYWCYQHQLDVRSAKDRELHGATRAEAAAGSRDVTHMDVKDAVMTLDTAPDVLRVGPLVKRLDVLNVIDKVFAEAAPGPRDATAIIAAHDKMHGESCDCDIACAIGDYEAEAAAGPREDWETFVGPDGKRVPVKFAEAAAGPRETLPTLDELRRMRAHEVNAFFAAHDIDWRVAEAAAGPEPESPASAWLEGYRQGRIEAEAAAGPRDEGLDVERLARAMQNVEDELTATNIAYEYAALAKASDHD